MPGKFKVYITRYAYSQLKEIRQYIAEELFIPDTAGLMKKRKKFM